jgi:hypothetical protein
MLWNVSVIKGCAIAANDGRIGTISDFLFDDVNWQVHWLVVDTGDWLPGRKVLLTPAVMGPLDPERGECSVELTMQQIENSPGVDTEWPLSRRMESNRYISSAWMVLYAPTFEPSRSRSDIASQQSGGDPHLRSTEAITGYHIHAGDSEIGHIDDFLLEDTDWSIHYLVADTKNWWPGKKVLIPPQSVSKIDWAVKIVNLDIDRQKVEDSPAFEASTLIDADYEHQFKSYNGNFLPRGLPS